MILSGKKPMLSQALLFYNEYSMLSQALLGLIDNRLRQATGKHEELFGGVAIILTGDPGQLLPVGGTPLYQYPPTTQLASQGYYCYQQFDKAVYLEKNVRQQNHDNDSDQEKFIKLLTKIRDGKFDEDSKGD